MRAGLLVVALSIFGETSARAESCSISSVPAVAFGSCNVFDASQLSAGSLSFTCSGVQPSDTVTIELTGVSDSATPRAMASGSHLLHYQLYLDAARTLIWGTGAGGTVTYGPVHSTDGVPTAVPIYGRARAPGCSGRHVRRHRDRDDIVLRSSSSSTTPDHSGR